MTFKKGHPNYLSHHSKETIQKVSNENNYNWKGDNVGYDGLHRWLRKHMPKPDKCEFCHKSEKKLQAACVTGVYNRDFSNWKYLCAKCHIYHDGTINNLNRTGPQYQDMNDRFCKTCKSNITLIGTNQRPIWYGFKNNWMCRRCYKKTLYWKKKE